MRAIPAPRCGSPTAASRMPIMQDRSASFVKAARRLGVHQNTVAHRFHRTEELPGRRTRAHQLELRSALRLAHLLRGAEPA